MKKFIAVKKFGNKVMDVFAKKHQGIDGFMVTVGLCIIALVICVLMKDQLSTFITTLVGSMTTKATGMLG